MYIVIINLKCASNVLLALFMRLKLDSCRFSVLTRKLCFYANISTLQLNQLILFNYSGTKQVFNGITKRTRDE